MDIPHPTFSLELKPEHYIFPYRYPLDAEDYWEWRHFWRLAKGKGVEVGVLEGQNAEEALKWNPNITELTLIDPWLSFKDVVGDLSVISQPMFDEIYERVKGRFSNDIRIKVLRKTSPQAAEDFKDHSLDFVYLDGDHTEPIVLAELRAWVPKLKSGGLMGGHDAMESSVLGALVRFFQEDHLGYFESKLNTWWFYVE